MFDYRGAWVLLANMRCGRLLKCRSSARARCHVEEIDRVENTWEGHEHGRPSPLAGKSGHSYASEGHQRDEDLDRFARKVAIWLKPQISDHDIDRLTIFAPPRFLGAFRKIRIVQMDNCLEDRHEDLIDLDAKRLSDHRSIRELVGLTTSNAVR